MKFGIARYLLTAVGIMGMAATPALFADDLHRDIRADRYRLREDLAEGRYRAAARVRADLNRDIRRDEYRRYDWR